MKDKCYVCKVMCNIGKAKEQKACAFEHNGDENICPFDARYLDLSVHDKQIRAKTVNNFVSNAITEFQKFDKEHGYPTLGDISVILSDVAEQLKEQNK